ncbi:hypothetical protein FRC06_009461 [Ceratobasidium sp. 370]|nr:hypothetical protein FRC06_009461 [Ceratobasidium sp. 370]
MVVKTAIPITVFTGFLGAGKTTIILSLLPKLPKDYKVVLLKNEFGDVEGKYSRWTCHNEAEILVLLVDSQLAANSSLAAVSEILNGCMCCILVGQMKTALLEIRDQYHPDRIIIESSGSAFPATLAFQIRELERETDGDFKLDAIVTVVDSENFTGYEDTSPTAKMQAQYTDVILLNKWEHVSERDLDIVIDHLSTLNDLTPKLRCEGKSGVPPDLLFGLDSKQFLDVPGSGSDKQGDDHHREVETMTLHRGAADLLPRNHAHEHNHAHDHDGDGTTDLPVLTSELLGDVLGTMPKDSVYRVKGFVSLQSASSGSGIFVLNWAFGRFELVLLTTSPRNPAVERMAPGDLLLTVMGAVGDVRRYGMKMAQRLGARAV